MADEKTWECLFKNALRLVDEILTHGTKHLYWTFGGGTVLMLKYQHRISKDIDIFVPDPQALNYVNPRLSQVAEDMTVHYDEANDFIKLFLPEGEIDFVASPNLTERPYVDEKLSYNPPFDRVRDVVIQMLDAAAQNVEEQEKRPQCRSSSSDS